MPPKAKGPKNLQSIALLNSAQTTYKAACRRHGVPMHKAIALQLEKAVVEGAKIDKLCFSGPEEEPAVLMAALELAAVYPGVRNVSCWGCSLGDKGLLALSQLLKASSDRWWKGSKLRLLELVADGVGTPPDKWPERFFHHMNGGLAMHGAGHAQPSLLLCEVEAVTPLTLSLARLGLASPSPTACQAQLDSQAACGGPLSSLHYRSLASAQTQEQEQQAARRAAGMLAVAPAASFLSTSPRKARDMVLPPPLRPHTAPPLQQQLGRAGGPGPIPRAGVVPLLPALVASGTGEVGRGPGPEGGERVGEELRGQNGGWSVKQLVGGAGGSGVARGGPLGGSGGGSSSPLDSSRRLTAGPKASMAVRMGQGAGVAAAAAAGSSGAIGPEAQQEAAERAEKAAAVAAAVEQLAFAAGTSRPGWLTEPGVSALRPMSFSVEALQTFALGLRTQGHGLQVLVLDHNQLGDLGAQALAAGLARCPSLQHLSLEGCGVGAVGGAALGATMVPHPDPLLAALTPKYVHLNLSRNPLGGPGVAALCDGLAAAAHLKVLNLSSVGLTADDLLALELLSEALAANASIAQVDLDANFIGDAGASVFVPMLSAATHIRKFRITARGMTRSGGGGQVAELMRAKFPRKKVARKLKKK